MVTHTFPVSEEGIVLAGVVHEDAVYVSAPSLGMAMLTRTDQHTAAGAVACAELVSEQLGITTEAALRREGDQAGIPVRTVVVDGVGYLHLGDTIECVTRYEELMRDAGQTSLADELAEQRRGLRRAEGEARGALRQ